MSLLQERMREPVHYGPLQGATSSGAVGNPACGDVVTIHLRVVDERIEAASFESLGSKYQLATASVLCDCVTGQRIEEAMERTPTCVLEKLEDLPDRHRHLARLAIDALRLAVRRHGEPSGDEGPALPEMAARDAEAFLRRLLADGRRWTSLEVHAMAEAEGVAFPGSTVRFLSACMESGVVEGELDAARSAWTWWIPDDNGP